MNQLYSQRLIFDCQLRSNSEQIANHKEQLATLDHERACIEAESEQFKNLRAN